MMVDEQKDVMRDLLFSSTNMAALTSREKPLKDLIGIPTVGLEHHQHLHVSALG